jgi:hypothetical protein
MRAKDLAIEIEITKEGLKNLSMQKRRTSTPETIRQHVFPSNPVKYPQQCEVTMIREYKNNNGKRNPKMRIIGKKVRNLSKKKAKLEKL